MLTETEGRFIMQTYVVLRRGAFENSLELDKATAICEEYLNQFGPSAQAFFLLGIIRDAADDASQAEKLFLVN